MNKNTLWIIGGVIVVLALGWWAYASMNAPTAVENNSQEVAGENEEGFVDGSKDGAAASPSAPTGAVVITHSENGFSPASVTVKQGTTVTFINEDGSRMWVGSDEHPSHTGYAGTSRSEHCTNGPSATAFDQCGATATYMFTFNKTGTWGYHNHVAADQKGTVVVTP